MNLLVVFLVFSQNGLENMCQAAGAGIVGSNVTCSPSRFGYFDTQESIISMRIYATNMAKHLNNNSELLLASVTSTEPAHRVAAAFAYGMNKNINENVYILANDNHDIVSQAAREAMVYVASTKYRKKGVDFGPFPRAELGQKEDSIKLWRIFFETSGVPTSQQPKSTFNYSQAEINALNAPAAKPYDNRPAPINNCPKCVPAPQEKSPDLYEVSLNREVKVLPKSKPITVAIETIDTETIPGFRIKRITNKEVENVD